MKINCTTVWRYSILVAVCVLTTVPVSSAKIRRRHRQLSRRHMRPTYNFDHLLKLMRKQREMSHMYHFDHTTFVQDKQATKKIGHLLRGFYAERKQFSTYMRNVKRYYHGTIPRPNKVFRKIKYFIESIVSATNELEKLRVVLASELASAGVGQFDAIGHSESGSRFAQRDVPALLYTIIFILIGLLVLGVIRFGFWLFERKKAPTTSKE